MTYETMKMAMQMRACLDVCDIPAYLAWKKAQEAKKNMVQISKDDARKIVKHLHQIHVKYMINADTFKTPEIVCKNLDNAREVEVLMDNIATALDPKEEP